MTFRAKPVSRRPRRRFIHGEERQQLVVTVGFIALIVLALVILGGAIVATYYNDHLVAVATVNGHNISKDQWRDREGADTYRLNAAAANIQAAVKNGAIDQNTAQQQIQQIQSALQSVGGGALDELVDAELRKELAAQKGITVTDQDVADALTKEGTSVEQRKISAIVITPGATPPPSATPTPSATASPPASPAPSESAAPSGSAASSAAPSASPSPNPSASPAPSPSPSASASPSPSPSASTGPTEQQKADAKAKAEQALAAIKAGTPFGDVAKKYSTDASGPQGGEFGYVAASSTSLDKPLLDAAFKLSLNGTTDVVQQTDGAYAIAQVTDIVPAKYNNDYNKGIESYVSLDGYRALLRDNLIFDKLQTAITDEATKGNQDQIHVWEIKVDTSSTTAGPEVKAANILYSPKGDPQNASTVPATDPSWEEAKKKADATAEKLKAITDPAKRAEEFATLAKSESNDTSSGANGGDLGWFTQASMVQEFADAVFKGTHAVGDVIGPVKSQFGWHVILYQGSRPAPADRLKDLQTKLAASGADWVALAKDNSDAKDASTGGDMGWKTRLQFSFDAATLDKIWNLDAGKVSEPIVQSDGTYFYRVTERASKPVDSAQESDLKSSAYTNWYALEKAKATIWKDPTISTGA